MKTVYLSSAYLAPIEYYAKLLAYDKVFIEQHDHYVKQTYRNRCTIGAFHPYRQARHLEMSIKRHPYLRSW